MKNILKCLFLMFVSLNVSLLAVLTPDEKQFLDAIERDDLKIVQYFIENKKTCVDFQYKGWTPVMLAASKKRTEIVRELLSNNAIIRDILYDSYYYEIGKIICYKAMIMHDYKYALVNAINSDYYFTGNQWLALSLSNKHNQVVLYAINYGYFKPQDILNDFNRKKHLPLDIALDLFGMLNKKQIKTFKKNVIDNNNFKMLALIKEYEFKKQMLSVGTDINSDIKLFYLSHKNL